MKMKNILLVILLEYFNAINANLQKDYHQRKVWQNICCYIQMNGHLNVLSVPRHLLFRND